MTITTLTGDAAMLIAVADERKGVMSVAIAVINSMYSYKVMLIVLMSTFSIFSFTTQERLLRSFNFTLNIPQDGVYKPSGSCSSVNHAVDVVGYGVFKGIAYWRVRNRYYKILIFQIIVSYLWSRLCTDLLSKKLSYFDSKNELYSYLKVMFSNFNIIPILCTLSFISENIFIVNIHSTDKTAELIKNMSSTRVIGAIRFVMFHFSFSHFQIVQLSVHRMFLMIFSHFVCIYNFDDCQDVQLYMDFFCHLYVLEHFQP